MSASQNKDQQQRMTILKDVPRWSNLDFLKLRISFCKSKPHNGCNYNPNRCQRCGEIHPDIIDISYDKNENLNIITNKEFNKEEQEAVYDSVSSTDKRGIYSSNFFLSFT
jgi:hypothetical protein